MGHGHCEPGLGGLEPTGPNCRCCCRGTSIASLAKLTHLLANLCVTRAPACRLGGNYLMLPVNAPKCAHHNNHHDGVMNFMERSEEASAWGFSLGS